MIRERGGWRKLYNEKLRIFKFYHIIPKIKCRIAMAKTGFSKKKKKTLFVRKLGLNLRNKPVKWYVWSMVCVVLKLGHFGQ